MNLTKTQTIAQCVANNYQTAAIFKKHKIDFCCGGKISIEEACKNQNLNEEIILQELNEAIKIKPQEDRTENYELNLLTEHIIKVHHSYVRKKIPEIDPFLDRILRVHGQKHPELKKVQENFQEIKNELLNHMQKEEDSLFPYINKMVNAKKNKTQLKSSPNTLKETIEIMEKEHESAGDYFKEINEITNNLVPPSGTCNTYSVTFSLLKEFEDDLHRHIHLENNVLFPKAIILEESLLNKNNE